MNKGNVNARISTLPKTPLGPGLRGAILQRIERMERRLALQRGILLAFLAVLSAFAFMEGILYAANELYLSGFPEYVSLFFTDNDAAFSSWRELTSSLGESLPILPLIVLCAALLVLVWSVVRAASQFRTVKYLSA